MFEASHLQYNIVSGYIQIVSDGHHLPAFWAHPDLGGPFPALVLLHDIWGLTPHIRADARRFAERGFYVIAPDLFDGQTADTPEHAQQFTEAVGMKGRAYVLAALRALRTHHKCNGKIGLIGWGFGGQLAIHVGAARDDLRGVVAFYSVPEDISPAELRMMSSPLLAFFGADDPTTPADQIDALRSTLDATDVPHEIVVYSGAGREFFNDARPDAFNEEIAANAWQRALSFLNEHLEVPPPTDPETPDTLAPGQVY